MNVKNTSVQHTTGVFLPDTEHNRFIALANGHKHKPAGYLGGFSVTIPLDMSKSMDELKKIANGSNSYKIRHLAMPYGYHYELKSDKPVSDKPSLDRLSARSDEKDHLQP